jgi:hypothetical protein
VLAKWPVWPCGGRRHRNSVLRITLRHAFHPSFDKSFLTSVGEVAGLAVWWTAAPEFGLAHHASTRSDISFLTIVGEVAGLAVWWTAAPEFGPAHHASTRFSSLL